jgi:predicted ATP-grasp superfamily ATP-dependent carboligase
VVADLFGDVDTRRLAAESAIVPGDLAAGFDAPALLAAAERLAPSGSGEWGLVYGSGLESRPRLLAELARGRRLWGNRPDVLRATKDPTQFFGLLDRLGLPHPELQLDPPRDPDGWLVKSIGAAGGGHVQPAGGEAGRGPERYFQRRAEGRPVSCLILADGRQAALLGWSEQWPSPAPGQPFRFGGAVQPASVPASVVRLIGAALTPLVRETGLVGLNSLDLLLAEDDACNLLEINPRPGASLDIFDGPGESALFDRHVMACEGRLCAGWQAPRVATAMLVVYAEQPLEVPPAMAWPDWLADQPAPSARIEPGAPVCTVMARAAEAGAARALVMARGRAVLAALAAGDGATLASAGRAGDDPLARMEAS